VWHQIGRVGNGSVGHESVCSAVKTRKELNNRIAPV
jgi:hypothetical protein